MTDVWTISYLVLFLASLFYQLRRQGLSPSGLFDFLACLPLVAYLVRPEPFLPLLAFQIQALSLVAYWSRKAHRDQAESLSKFSFSMIMGNFLLLSHWILMQPAGSPLLWPFGALAAEAGIWYEALGAALVGVALLLLLGLPPLQQGWFDLSETQSSTEIVRSDFQLRLSLIYGLWAYLPFILETLSPALLEIIATTGIIALFLARLISSVQMSVTRTFAYQASALSLSFWVVLGMPSELAESLQLQAIGFSAILFLGWGFSLVSFQRRSSAMKPSVVHPHWDDAGLSPHTFRSLRLMQIVDLSQALLALALAWFAARYAIFFAVLIYLIACAGLFLDQAAFRARKSLSNE